MSDTPDTTNVRTMLRLLIRDGETPADAARTVLRMMVRPKFHAAAEVQFFPHLLWTANQVARADVRGDEHRVMRQVREAEEGGGSARIAPLVRVELADQCFALPDGRMVQWTLATADEHRARAAWQRRLAGQIVADADLHERAAAEIEAAGVVCLAEINGSAA